MADAIVLVIIGLCLAGSITYIIRNKKRGGSSCGCGCGCSGCSGSACCGKKESDS